MEDSESMTVAIVTTFNADGYAKYGKRMIESFCKHLPKEVEFLVFPENVNVDFCNDRIKVYDLLESSRELVELKNRWRNDPRANGNPPGVFIKSKEDHFKYDAVRFIHKVFAIVEANKKTCADYLIWVDGDTFAFADMTLEFLIEHCPNYDEIASYLGRPDHYSECGWVSYNRHTAYEFITAFANAYISEEIFTYQEWHDSWVFDRIREKFESTGYKFKNLAPAHVTKGQHVFINSKLGSCIDHMKGPRKDLGKSKPGDLKIKRSESYWKF
jgi:hypothetical protein